MGSAVVSVGARWLGGNDLDKYRVLLVVAFAAALVMLVLRVPSARVEIGAKPIAATETSTGRSSARRNFIVLFIAAAFLGASVALVFRFANVVFAQAYGLRLSDISIILGGDKIVSIFGAIFAPLVVKKFSLRPSAVVIGVLAAVGLVLQSLTIPLTIFVALYLARLLFNYGLMPLLDTVAMSGFTRSRHLVSISVRQSSFYLGGAVAAAVYGQLLSQGQWQAALLISAACALVGALAMALVPDAEASPRSQGQAQVPAKV
ncbi:MFS transporter [Lentzea sp. JNUCC 0626]|uniref:MFS transporter n=1 Tax=Lentzea sp. JNUCC 0626 TaxID=3367513 RepID=UPI00374A0C44